MAPVSSRQSMNLVLNNTVSNHLKILNQQFATAGHIWISVAYLKNTGFNSLYAPLNAALKRGAEIEVFCGLDFCITDPDAIEHCHALFKGTQAKLYLCEIKKVNFHPKVYCFRSNKHVTVVIGSANLSKGGLETNVELSTVELFRRIHDSRGIFQNTSKT